MAYPNKLRKEAINYMDFHQIPIQETASFFPNATVIDNVDLSGDIRSFRKFNEKSRYVFYSNVYNLSDTEFKILDKDYTPIQEFRKRRIRVVLYMLKPE